MHLIQSWRLSCRWEQQGREKWEIKAAAQFCCFPVTPHTGMSWRQSIGAALGTQELLPSEQESGISGVHRARNVTESSLTCLWMKTSPDHH